MEEWAMRQSMLVAAFLLMTTTAHAQESMQVAVVGYGKIPVGAAFQTELIENSEISAHVDESLRATLARHGLHYAPDASLVFSITADRTGDNSAAYAASNIARDDSQVHIALNTGDTSLTSKMPHTFRISLAVYERPSGHYVWRGEATELRPYADPFDSTNPMLERLATALDKSIGAAN
jgi:hypothetical protein